MGFFDVLVRYEVALWNAATRYSVGRGLVSLAQLHALRVIDRYSAGPIAGPQPRHRHHRGSGEQAGGPARAERLGHPEP